MSDFAVDCPCINATSVLAMTALAASAGSSDSCADDEVPFSKGGFGAGLFCYPKSYGSSSCVAHDQGLDPYCDPTQPQAAHCALPWCYVDPVTCKESTENMYRSHMFSDETQSLMYSYSTCGADASDWINLASFEILAGRTIIGTVPQIQLPYHVKYLDDGSLADPIGAEYLDDSLPWQGALRDYLDALVGLSNVAGFEMTHRSGGASVAVPGSRYTASVHDVQSGVADMAIGGFWITSARLEMVPFTAPMLIEQMVLWIPAPHQDESVGFKARMVIEPFTYQLWLSLFVCTIVHGLMTIGARKQTGFSELFLNGMGESGWNEKHCGHKIIHIVSIISNETFASMTELFSGGVFEATKISLPLVVLNLGWAVLILVSIAAYTSSLTAHLTKATVMPYVNSMDMAVNTGTRICAESALSVELQSWHPKANCESAASRSLPFAR